MPIDPVSAGLGAVSLITGKNANKKAQKSADSAGRTAKSIEERFMALFDKLISRADRASAPGGELDPERRIADLERDTARYESRDLGNLTGAMRIGGYKPGDSEIGTRQDAVKIKYRQYLDQIRSEIRSNAFAEQTNAYSAAGGVGLGNALGSAQTRQQTAQGQIQNPSNFFGGLVNSLRPQTAGGFNIRNYRNMRFSGVGA